MPIKAILFDFDLTLADSSRGATVCINYALGKLGFAEHSHEAIFKTIGLTLPEVFSTLTGVHDMNQEELFEGLFIDRADQVMAELTYFFEGVPEMIQTLKERNFILGIISTKYRYRIERILKREALLDWFDVIMGGEDVPRNQKKPHPAGILLALEKLNLSTQECLYVGDSIPDARAAESARVPFVAVLSGSTKDFHPYVPIQILDDVTQLVSSSIL